MPGSRRRAKAGEGYRSILVPLDGSRLSEQAIPLALAIAERAGARLRLAMVSVPRIAPSARVPLSPEARQLYVDVELEARKLERTYLRTFTDQLKKESPDLAISSTTLTGPVGAALLGYVGESKSDLVVMTSRGQGGLRRLWLGSVADAMIRLSSVPVLLVRPEENPAPRPVLENLGRILVPLDGSALAESALQPARRIASLAALELMLVQVIQPLAPPLESQSTALWGLDDRLTDLRQKEAAEYLRLWAEECLRNGVRAVYSVQVGASVADSILSFAEAGGVGLIALATHGRGGLKRVALGSVADKLVRTSSRPVLVYRPPARARGKRPPSAA